jgi:hypothetical protein
LSDSAAGATINSGEAVVLDRITPQPANGPSRRFLVLWLTLAVWATLAALLGAPALAGGLADKLGDTDDALRLVLVRDLVQGHSGWYAQHFTRLQPPFGMDLHWSRLVDGGIAAVELFFRLFLAPAKAEYVTRVAWPLLWIGPAVGATIFIARRLRGDNAAFACAAFLAVNYILFWQWSPGRIDHHDLQMTAALCALAGAVAGGRRGACLAGLATAGGLAVGIEALIFLGLVGAFFAVRFALDPTAHVRPARAYAAALLVGLVVLYLAQTPPAWWGVARCDMLGVNLVAAAGVACLGLLAATCLPATARVTARFAALGAVGIAAAGVYLCLEPACVHGPFAFSDPRIKPIWLSKVGEMQPILTQVRQFRANAVGDLVMMVLGLAAWLWLGRRRPQRSSAWLIVGGSFLAAAIAGAEAVRLAGYSSLFAAALLAAACADIAARFRWSGHALAVGFAVALSPSWPAAAVTGPASPAADNQAAKPASKLALKSPPSCTAPSAYAVLAKLAPGVVLNEIDLGPYILATTPHAAMAGPYHRADWGILAADAALAAPPGQDERAVRRLHVDYVVDCRNNTWYPRRKEIGPQSLQVRLDRGQTPTWLEPLSRPDEALQVYRVRRAPGA